MPEGSFGIMSSSGPSSLSTSELFSGKKVALFSVPGAFTPTCSNEHLPGFKNKGEGHGSIAIDVSIPAPRDHIISSVNVHCATPLPSVGAERQGH